MLPKDDIVSHEKRIDELENKVRFYEELVNQLPHHFTYKNPQIGLQIKKTRSTHSIQNIQKRIKRLIFSLLAIHYFYLNNLKHTLFIFLMLFHIM